MPDIIVFAPNGREIGLHIDADFEATDIGVDVPDGNIFTSIKTPGGTVEYWGTIIIKVVKTKKEGE